MAAADAHAGPPGDNGAAAKNGAAATDGSAGSPAAADSVVAGAADTPGSVDNGADLAAATMNGHAGEHSAQAQLPAQQGQAQQGQAQQGQARNWTATLTAWLNKAEATVRTHWLASILIAAGLVMRMLVQAAYTPAIVYIDTLKYLYGAWPGSDPVAYKIPLKMILALGGNLNTVELFQHLLGIGIAITLYLVLIRRGTPLWLAALAMAPVLFDAYQLQAEAMIMPDVLFEAVIVAGLAVLLWQKRPTMPTLIIGALLLGASTGVRQVGEIMIVPAVVLAIVLGGGLRKVLVNVVVVVWSFLLAIVLYMGASYALTHHLRISYSGSSLTYGRMAYASNCATLTFPSPAVKLLCPTPYQKAQGPDWLEHSGQGPLRTLAVRLAVQYPNLVGDKSLLESEFNHAVERQQPLRVLDAVARDSVKIFALTRDTSPGDTPIWRWQFHGYYPVYGQYVSLVNNRLYIKLPHQAPKPITARYGGGGRAMVDVPIARFLRSYQINGGYTPGPLLLICVLAGLAGSLLLAFRRRLTPAVRELGIVCITLFSAVLAVEAISDAFEFSWRYQLPAIIVLPAVGAAGIAMIMAFVRQRRQPATPQAVPERAPEPAPAQ